MRRPHILIVDDDPAVRSTFRMVLGRQYSFEEAESPYQAELRLRERPPDLVLLDLNLRGGSGLEVLPVLRRNAPETAVVIITACGTYEATLEAFQHGVADFLEKDFRPSELRRRIGAVFERRGPSRSEEQSAPPSGSRPQPGGGMDIAFFSTLSRVMESQDYVTAGHSLRVSRYAVAVARRLGLEDDLVKDLELASFMHDVGKVGVNKSVLNKEGSFSRLDRVEVERHPVLGEEIIKPLGYGVRILRGVRHHHERLDGSGYPDGIGGSEVGLLPRIIAVVDSFDAMTWQRLYRPIPISPMDALAALAAEAPSKYDSDVVAALSGELVAGGIDTRVDPIRAHTRTPAEEVPSRGPPPDGDHDLEDTAGFDPERDTMDQATRDILSDPLVIRARFGALPDLFANPEREGAPVVQLLSDHSGPHAFLDPEPTDGEVRRPLRGRHWLRLWELVAHHHLRAFYRVPGTLTVDPALHLPLAGSTRDDAWQEFTDGERRYVAQLARPEPGGPITYRLSSGHVRATVAHAQLRPRRAWAASHEDPVVRVAAAWMDDPANEAALRRVEDWIDARARAGDFYAATTWRPPRAQDRQRASLRLSPGQIEALASMLDVPEKARAGHPLLALLRERGGGGEPGAVEVTWRFLAETSRQAEPLWEGARGVRLADLPVYQAEHAAAARRLDELGVETLEGATQPRSLGSLRVVIEGLSVVRRHLAAAGEICAAAEVDAASRRALATLITQHGVDEAMGLLSGVTLRSLSRLSGPARDLLKRVPLEITLDDTLGRLEELMEQRDPQEALDLARDLRACCEASFDTLGGAAVRRGGLWKALEPFAASLDAQPTGGLVAHVLTGVSLHESVRRVPVRRRAHVLRRTDGARPSGPNASDSMRREYTGLRAALERAWVQRVRVERVWDVEGEEIDFVDATLLSPAGPVGEPAAARPVTRRLFDRGASLAASSLALGAWSLYNEVGGGEVSSSSRVAPAGTGSGFGALALSLDDEGSEVVFSWSEDLQLQVRGCAGAEARSCDGGYEIVLDGCVVQRIEVEVEEGR